MKVDFLTFFEKGPEFDLHGIIAECLWTAYEDNYDEAPEQDDLDRAINIRYVRWHQQVDSAEGENGTERYVAGLSIDFNAEDSDEGERLAKGFCRELVERKEEGISHVLKLNDPYMREINHRYAGEIFEIEMKLREAISLIFIDTYGEKFYDLLRETVVNRAGKDVNEEQLRAHFENEFFFLLFSDYRNLNERRLPNNTKYLLSLISACDDFRELREHIDSNPIKLEDYASFLASLKSVVEPIENVRNSIAHNRAISQNAINNYEQAKVTLLDILDGFIGFPLRDDVGLWWEEEAVKAMQQALAEADWDYEQGIVEVKVDPDIGRLEQCSTYEELLNVLTEIGSGVACAYMPFEGGEPVFGFDDVGAAESVISKYEENLQQLGWEY